MTNLSPTMTAILRDMAGRHLSKRPNVMPLGRVGVSLRALESRRLVRLMDDGTYELTKLGMRAVAGSMVGAYGNSAGVPK